MVVFVRGKSVLCLLVLAVFLVGCVSPAEKSALLQPPYSIAVEEFRWTVFPLRVLVDMNQWSVPAYAVAVGEALDDWMKSIWNYTQTFNDTSLPVMSYVFYVSSINATQDYDVLVTFAPDRMPPGSSIVGLTTYDYDLATHEPITPIIINVTTSFATANSLFVKDVVMHEFGHALGLGHASSPNTSNGPEVMYYSSTKNEIVYPSTLDVYGLSELYRGVFNQTVQLPFNVPCVMLTEGTVPTPTVTSLVTSLWEDYEKYVPIIVVLLLVMVAAIVLARIKKEKSPEEPAEPLPPPPPPTG